MVGLFIISALVPLCLCAAFLLHNFSAEQKRTQRQSLDVVVRSYGMTLLGRLGNADDVLMALVRQPGMTDSAIQDAVAKMPWVSIVRRAIPGQPHADSGPPLPIPDARQLRALRAGDPVLLWGADELGGTQVYLVRRLQSDAWLYTGLSPAWLWADARDYAGDAALAVLDDHGKRLLATADVEPELLRVPGTATAEVIAHGSMARSWELFLAGRFNSPSWRMVAISGQPAFPANGSSGYLYLLALIVLTILMIAWLSMTTIRRQLRPLELLTQATRRVAQRDFLAFRDMSWNDEFGDLARSFDTMSDKLSTQFAALETLAEVDRLLLSAPQLEVILDTLLPRVADLLGCDTVSVLLFDTDSSEHARVYDFQRSQGKDLPVRRIACDTSALRATLGGSLPPIDVRSPGFLDFLVPPSSQLVNVVHLQPLKRDGESVGALCIGYTQEAHAPQEYGITVADFADRLSLILANLEQAERIRRQANFDALTGLQNRHLFSEHLRSAIAGADTAQATGGLLYIDLDHFKHVNDTAGHAAGDKLLRIVAARLTDCAGDGHKSIARLGGDEFAVLLPVVSSPHETRGLAERIIVALERPIVVDAREHRVSASIGMTAFPADGTSLEDLLKAGDIAMYHAKSAGRGRAVSYQASMQRKLIERMKLEGDMQRAFHRGDFLLHYQPIVSADGQGTLAVEALLRWPRSDNTPWISPAGFIPVAEENGLIVKLGDWVLRSACGQFARWRDAGLVLDHVSVNVSVRQLREPGFIAAMLEALRDNCMRGAELQLEITESVLAAGQELARSLSEIAAHGVSLALDDFGTGYSSLSYLRSYPIHTLKIDQSFIVGLPHDPAACRLVESIILMCSALGKRVVAEGVETKGQRDFLRQAGCMTLQGYFLGRPMEATDIPGFARRLRSVDTTAAEDYDARSLPTLAG